MSRVEAPRGRPQRHAHLLRCTVAVYDNALQAIADIARDAVLVNIAEPHEEVGAGAVRTDVQLGLQRSDHVDVDGQGRSEEHTSELQSLMRISYAVFCLKKNKIYTTT